MIILFAGKARNGVLNEFLSTVHEALHRQLPLICRGLTRIEEYD